MPVNLDPENWDEFRAESHRALDMMLDNLRDLLLAIYLLRWRVHPKINLENPAMHSVPFGTATALSMLMCFGLTQF